MQKSITSLLGLLTGVLLISSTAVAEVRLPNIFSDHLVLQQKQANRLWGWADAGEQIGVSIAGQSNQTTADADGFWSLTLPSRCRQDRILCRIGQSQPNRTQGCAGWRGLDLLCQSNMQWSVRVSSDPDLEALAANFPNIRMINYPQTGSQQPIMDHPGVPLASLFTGNDPFFLGGWLLFRPTVASDLGRAHRADQQRLGRIGCGGLGESTSVGKGRKLLSDAGKLGPAGQAEELAAKGEEISEEESKKLKDLQNRLRGNHRPANIYNGVLKSHIGYGIRGAFGIKENRMQVEPISIAICFH